MIYEPIPCTDLVEAVEYVLVGREARIIAASDRVLAALPLDPATPQGARQIAIALDANTALRPNILHPYCHGTLSLPPGEHLGRAWITASEEMLRANGLDPLLHDFLVVQHSDKPHDHCHLIHNRIGADATLIRDRLGSGATNQATCRTLEKQFGLRQLASSLHEEPGIVPATGEHRKRHPSRAEYEMKARGLTPDKEMFRSLLQEVWPAPGEILSYSDLTERWGKAGIQVEMCRKGSRVGLVYAIGDKRKKASDIGKEFQWASLEGHIREDISPQDIGALRSVAPSTNAPKVAGLPPPAPTPDPVGTTPGRPKKPIIQVPMDLAALMEDAYARFSAQTTEARRARRAGPPIPKSGHTHPRNPQHRHHRR